MLFRSYSAVMNGKEFRILAATAALNDLEFDAIDIKQAFTYGPLDTELFCNPPEGYDCPPGKVLQLKKALYGCKQAAVCFKDFYEKFYIEHGFKPLNDAKTIFKKEEGPSFIISGIFVDDSANIHNDPKFFDQFCAEFAQRFDIKIRKNVDVFLGVQIIRNRSERSLKLSQKHYLTECLKRFGLETANGAKTPMSERLTVKDQPSTIDSTRQTLYREMVGCGMWIAVTTRPDIAYAVQECARHVSNPGEIHLKALKRIFRYLKHTSDLGLHYHPPEDGLINVLHGATDSDWAGCPDTRRSTTGNALKLNGAAIAWRSKRQSIVALSVAEAEYVSTSAQTQEVMYIRKLLTNLGFPQQEPTIIYADNATCIAWSEGTIGGSDRAKHMDLRVHFIHDAVKAGHIKLQKIDTKLNYSDILTKPTVSADSFVLFRRQLLGC